ncbi:unnamed protein product [Closterium sp. Naga37s-1]|nr:unnamed protein product [Closterium sp. Naga37s-1]
MDSRTLCQLHRCLVVGAGAWFRLAFQSRGHMRAPLLKDMLGSRGAASCSHTKCVGRTAAVTSAPPFLLPPRDKQTGPYSTTSPCSSDPPSPPAPAATSASAAAAAAAAAAATAAAVYAAVRAANPPSSPDAAPAVHSCYT